MSKLGLNNLLKDFESLEKKFFDRAIKESKKEFRSNFNKERNHETDTDWDMVLRVYPPPILDVSGLLKNEVLNNKHKTFKGVAILTVNPIDERGRGYAKYHQEGFFAKNGDFVAPREFFTQSSNLTRKHKEILLDETHKIFTGKDFSVK